MKLLCKLLGHKVPYNQKVDPNVRLVCARCHRVWSSAYEWASGFPNIIKQ